MSLSLKLNAVSTDGQRDGNRSFIHKLINYETKIACVPGVRRLCLRDDSAAGISRAAGRECSALRMSLQKGHPRTDAHPLRIHLLRSQLQQRCESGSWANIR